MLRKLPIVAVLGSGSPIASARVTLAREVGALVARLGAHLLTGAGFGVMAAAAEGFVSVADRRGFSLGIVPRDPAGSFDTPKHADDGTLYPNPFVEIAVRTPLPSHAEEWRVEPSRNHVNVLTADAIVALPGAEGTCNELDMAVLYRGEAARPPAERKTVLLGPAEQFPAEIRSEFVHAPDVGAARQHLARVLAAGGFPTLGAFR